MMYGKCIRTLIVALVLCLFAAQAYTLDYPHTDVNNITCNSCHFVYGDEPSLLPEWTNQVPQNIDDTQYNILCWGCHDDDEAPFVRTHSSLEIDNGYGNWTVECRICHNPHQQRQLKAYAVESHLYTGNSTAVTTSTLTEEGAGWTSNEYSGKVLIPDTEGSNNKYGYKIISNTSDTLTVQGPIDTTKVDVGDTFAIIYGKLINDTIDISEITDPGVPKEGEMTVKLFDSTGANSFADGDGIYDGVCEVCHTQTLYHQNNPSGLHNHNPGKKCTTCHQHIEGFKGSGCDVCHGYPPVLNSAIGGPEGLVNNPAPTGSETAGAHDMHVNTKHIPCESCHYNSVGNGPTHNPGTEQNISIGFSLFNDTYLGGIYDGQTTAGYDSSEVNTTVTNTGAKSCSLLYCHSNAAPFDGVNEYKYPTWDGSVTCSSCHDEGGSNSFLSGKHAKHTDGSRHGFECEKCHYQTADGSSAIRNQSFHVNNVKDVIFSAGGVLDSGTKACTNTYCHSDAAGGPPNTPVEWDSGFSIECYSCHSGRSTDDIISHCTDIGGTWDGDLQSCTFADQGSCEASGGVWDASNGCYTVLTMSSNGHKKLVSKKSDREYPCYTCHDNTTNESNELDGFSSHSNGTKDIAFPERWQLFSGPQPGFDPDTKVCDNFYCHSDGTTVDPEVRPYPWDGSPRGCNACHGHDGDCAECHTEYTSWPAGQEWKSAMPMYTNTGAGTARANVHTRHMLTDFTCDECHERTVVGGGVHGVSYGRDPLRLNVRARPC